MDEKQGDALSKMRCNNSLSCLLVITLLDSKQSHDLACNPCAHRCLIHDWICFKGACECHKRGGSQSVSFHRLGMNNINHLLVPTCCTLFLITG